MTNSQTAAKMPAVLVTGSGGLVGSGLVSFLESQGFKVTALKRPRDWNPATGAVEASRLEGFDAIVHLAGENIASGRWTTGRKKIIRESRAKGTRLLAETIAQLSRPPKVFVSASAIGYYGDRGGEVLSEDSPAGKGFLAEVCQAWEEAAEPASRSTRVVMLRFGMVLSAGGGALAKMLPPFRTGVGGVLGSGRQYMSWITLQDLCRVVHHAIVTASLSGPVNAVSPSPVTNHEFTRALASAVHRPALFPVPSIAVRLAFGELAEPLMLYSTRAVPSKLEASGFRFEDPDLDIALHKIAGRISTLSSAQWIPRPIDEVFPFFADASNLERITPPWLRFEIRNPDVEMRRGAIINYRLRIHGIPVCWQSEIVDWQPPHRFVDAQRRGPYSLWVHEHRFEPREGGTLVHDEIRYSAPGGRLLQKLFVDRDLNRIFQYRKARLKELLA